jgi:hypothetical protein
MSILHRTYRVIRLRVIYLLNTRQGVREKVTGKVSETTEKFRREHRKSFGKTEKLFQIKPLIQKGFGKHRECFGGCQIGLVISGIFLEKKPKKSFGAAGVVYRVNKDGFKLNHLTGNVPERVQIILEGAGNVLGPSGIF